MLNLAIVWFLLVMPGPTAAVPAPTQFKIETVKFVSIADCDAAGRSWVEELKDAAFAPRHKLVFGAQRQRYAPADANVTFTCVDRDQ